jgi:excisionase family DNA binding protein
MKNYLTVTQAAIEADVHRLTVHYWIKTAKVKAYRVGHRFRIRIEDWQDFNQKGN